MTLSRTTKRKWLFCSLGIIQIFIAIGAIPAGIGYLLDTSGKGMGVTTEMLSHSPLKDFLIPGLCLLIIHGFGNVFGAVFSFRKKRLAGHLGIFFGTAQVIWITVQVAWISFSSFMQPLFFIIGTAELILGILIYRYWRTIQSV